MQKIEERRHKSQFSEDLQTLLFRQLCLAALEESKINMKDLEISMSSLNVQPYLCSGANMSENTRVTRRRSVLLQYATAAPKM